MHIVALRNLEKFWQQSKGKAAEGALKAWFAEAKAAKWTSPQDIKKQYANACQLKVYHISTIRTVIFKVIKLL